MRADLNRGVQTAGSFGDDGAVETEIAVGNHFGCIARVAADGMVVGEDIFHVPIHMTAFHDDAVGNARIDTHGGADAVEGVALPDLVGVPLQRGAAAVNLQQRQIGAYAAGSEGLPL